jgi:pimeloyl-ACP methyl ester carboxylesterase
MLARIQQLTTIGLVLLAMAWSTAFILRGSLAMALGGALLIVFGYAAFLAVEFVLMGFVNRGDSAPHASVPQLVKAWWGEIVTAPGVFCWRQPFRSQAIPDTPLTTACAARRGIVFVHGFVCNRGFWNPWMRRLSLASVPFVAVNLEPVFGAIDQYAGIIERAVAELEAATGLPPVIVAHSMGGLAVRAWLRQHGSDHRVHRVITIGSPHRGTWIGRFAHMPNARQMRLDAAWHQDLTSLETRSRRELFVCYYSNCDNIVFPASTATLPDAENRHIAGVAHVHLAFQPQIYEDVLRCVTSGAR